MTKYEERLQNAYKEWAENRNITVEEAKADIKNQWGGLGDRGYEIFTCDEFEAEHIERIDELNVFDDDIEAAKQAEKDGIKLIPWREQPKIAPLRYYRFIDTKENRRLLERDREKFS